MRNIGGVLVIACASLFFACGEGEENPPTQPTGPAAPASREPTVKANWEMGEGGGGSSTGSGDYAPTCEGNDDCEPPLVCSAAGRCRTPEEAAKDAPAGGGGLGGGGFGGGGGCLDDSDCAAGETCDPLFGFCYDAGAGGGGFGGGGGGGGTGSGTFCIDDFDCPLDEECGADGTCVPYGSAGGGACIDDFDCAIDEICYEGTCEPY